MITTPTVADALQVSPRALYHAVKAFAPLPKAHILILHWHTPDGKEKSKRYEYSVVRVPDGVTTIAVAALQLKKFAQKAPEPVTASLDPRGFTFTYENGTMHLQALGEYEEMPVVDLRTLSGVCSRNGKIVR